MKKTLFVAALVAACSGVYTEAAAAQTILTPTQISPGVDNYATVPGIYVYTQLDISSSSGYLGAAGSTFGWATTSGGVCIGTFNGDGALMIHGEGVEVSTPNNLYIGGSGYWGNDAFKAQYPVPEGFGTGHDGAVTVKDGATLSVAKDQADWNGSQCLIGTSGYASKGSLTVDNATFNAGARVAVGGGASEGDLTLSNGAVMNIAYGDKLTQSLGGVALYAATQAGSKGTVTVEGGSKLIAQGTAQNDFAVIGQGGSAELIVKGEGSRVEFNDSNTFIGYNTGSHGEVSVSDGASLDLGSLAILGYSSGSDGSLSVEKGAAVVGKTVYAGYQGAGSISNDGVLQADTLTVANGKSGFTNGTDGTATVGKTANNGSFAAQKLHVGQGTTQGSYNTGSLENYYVLEAEEILLTDDASLSNMWLVEAGEIELSGESRFDNAGAVLTNTLALGGDSKFSNAVDATVATEETRVADSAQLKVADLCVGGGALGSFNTITLVNGDGSAPGSGDTPGVVVDGVFSIAGGSAYNYGLMDAQNGIQLGDDGYLLTGVVSVSGRDNVVNDGVAATLDYATGLTEGTRVSITGVNVAVGATVTSATEKHQYVTGDDLKAIDAKVLDGLGLAADAAKVVNELDSSVTASLTTGEVNDTDESVVVSVEGSTVIIDKASDENAPTTGTIGSYASVVTETEASIRVNETSTGGADNVIAWKGDALKTIGGEETVLTTQTSVVLDATNDASKLVVVENSSLDNKGYITGNVQVDGSSTGTGTLSNHGVITGDVKVDGALKGTGKVVGTISVSGTGHLVVGNSPGAMTVGGAEISGALDISVAGFEKPADADVSGWNSATYSQLIISGGKFELANSATINILLGGNDIFDGSMNKEILFDMAIVTGITEMTIDGVNALAGGTLTANAVQFLEDHTSFSLTNELLGIPSVDSALTGFQITEMTYSVESDGQGAYELHVSGKMLVPEPATATLSLLALAALAARRRRMR